MRLELLDILACPTCHGELACHGEESDESGEIVTGTLRCERCDRAYPIQARIPRFVPTENYASSFGYQWNLFRREQIDSESGTTQSRRRLYSETGWDGEWLRGKWVLDAGCGAGRFLDVVSENDCQVVGVDISSAIDAAAQTVAGRSNVHLVQASIFDLPFRPGVFDACYCIGVIQHTPDPERAVRSLPRVLKDGGRIAVTIYERNRYTLLNGKYLVRPVTRRLPKEVLLAMLRGVMPVVFPLTEVLFRLPGLGRLMRFAIPVANYVDDPELSWRERYRWAVLDTFDMLSPEYDDPQREAPVRETLQGAGIGSLKRLPNPGLNLVGSKVPAQDPSYAVR